MPVDPDETNSLAGKPHALGFEMRGREMRGWLRVDAEGVRTRRQPESCVTRGVSYALSLPAEGRDAVSIPPISGPGCSRLRRIQLGILWIASAA